MLRQRLTIGQQGEQLAFRYLKKSGFRILARNYSCPIGEIDIIAYREGVISFVEVKTRTHERDLPELAVHSAKRRKLGILARHFLRENKLEHLAYQFDIIAILLSDSQEPDITHYAGAFTPHQNHSI